MNTLNQDWALPEGFQYWETPHWKNRDDYPTSGDDLADWQWRWEFLRRNSEYLQDWQTGEPTERQEWRAARYDPGSIPYVYRLPAMLDPTYDVRGKRDIFQPSGGKLIIPMQPDEAFDLIEQNDIKSEHQLEFLREVFQTQQSMIERVHEGFAALALFTLNAPLKPQLEAVEHLLKEAQKDTWEQLIQFRKRKGLWPIFLRLLDATHQGNPRPMEIYNHLLDEAEKYDPAFYERLNVDNPATLISDWQDAARELRRKAILYL